MNKKVEAQITHFEHSMDVLKEARHTLIQNPGEKYAPHFKDHDEYKNLLDYIDARISHLKDARDLWASGAMDKYV